MLLVWSSDSQKSVTSYQNRIKMTPDFNMKISTMYNILYIYNIYLDRHPRASVLWRQYLRPQFFNQFLFGWAFINIDLTN